jgi:hypothetical protein
MPRSSASAAPPFQREPTMTHKPPPVPPANRSPKGTGSAAEAPTDERKQRRSGKNAREQGPQGNIAQNTTHQGYQQDR